MANELARLTVRKQLLSLLSIVGSALFGWTLKITTREAGFVDCFIPAPLNLPSNEVHPVIMTLVAGLREACSSLGIQFQLISAYLNDEQTFVIRFTNDLITYQGSNIAGESGFGSRGNNKQVRAMLNVPTFPELVTPVEATPVEATPVEATPVEATPVVPSGPSEAEIAEAQAKMLAEVEARLEQASTEDVDYIPEPTPEEHCATVLAEQKAKGKGKGKGKNK